MYYVLTVRLPEELEKRLANLSRRTCRPKSHYVKEALTEYIEDLEDIHLADNAIEELRAGRTETHTLEEVKRELDLED